MQLMRQFFVLGLLCASVVATHALGNNKHVEARLLADVERVTAGQPFRLGVVMEMEERWHTYWRHSGDAGFSTNIQWQLPNGFSAGPLQWPLPHKYVEDGDLTVYGYGDQNMLFAQIVPPAVLPADTSLVFEAAVSWLVCREYCLPGETQLALTLPVGTAAADNSSLFASYAARVPQPLGAEDLEMDFRSQLQDEGVRVDITLKAKSGALEVDDVAPDFYPFDVAPFSFLSPRIEATDQGARLRLQLSEPAEVLRGVLVYRLVGQKEVRAGEVTLDLGAVGAGGALLETDFKLADAEAGRASLGFYLLLAAVGGLILNLMPCVLPVISLKVVSFVSQASEDRARVRQLVFAFSAGIVAAFLTLALVVILLKAGGEQIGWGFQFQYPGFVMAMAALVFALGLSLFGVYTVRLPGIQGGSGDGEGLGTSFFNGVLTTVLATPCTAPFLGTALGFAFSQSAASVWAIFFSIGLGMALPYVLLALQPGWMRFIPRPGDWMERFKQFMGFLLMATVLWLLWVLGKQVGVEGVIWMASFLLCLALACWIVGQWIDLRSGRRQRLGAWALALLVVVGGYVILLNPLLAAPTIAQLETESDEGWLPFSVEGVEELIAAKRHVFIDFTAEWCWTCKVNERTVLADEQVRARFAAMDMALVKADWTNRNPQITQLLRAFGRSGVPLYVILPSGRADEPIVLPEVITTGIVLEKLDVAARATPLSGI